MGFMRILIKKMTKITISVSSSQIVNVDCGDVSIYLSIVKLRIGLKNIWYLMKQ